jgi:hypothetical protein
MSALMHRRGGALVHRAGRAGPPRGGGGAPRCPRSPLGGGGPLPASALAVLGLWVFSVGLLVMGALQEVPAAMGLGAGLVLVSAALVRRRTGRLMAPVVQAHPEHRAWTPLRTGADPDVTATHETGASIPVSLDASGSSPTWRPRPPHPPTPPRWRPSWPRPPIYGGGPGDRPLRPRCPRVGCRVHPRGHRRLVGGLAVRSPRAGNSRAGRWRPPGRTSPGCARGLTGPSAHGTPALGPPATERR